MNMQVSVAIRMEYIQKLFQDVERVVEKLSEWDEIFAHLNKEQPLFRSIGYESASFVIGVKAISQSKSLSQWKEFRRLCDGEHTFHIDIGLGWAFAKTGMQHQELFNELTPAMQWMVCDGMGYYHGLFKGRTTIKQGLFPPGIRMEAREGFDEGLGRRLWYMAKGNVDELLPLVKNFTEERHAALWQGIGIACGYVGGNSEEVISALLNVSGTFEKSFATGIILATVSRLQSLSMDEDTERTFGKVCKMDVEDLNITDLTSEDIYNLVNKKDAGIRLPLIEILPLSRINDNGLIVL